MSKDLKDILKKAEIKRVGERITKKELCNVYKINYNFYMNCVSGRNLPSNKMIDDLSLYLVTSTQEMYNKVLSAREAETSFHDDLDVDVDELEKMINTLKSQGFLNLDYDEVDNLLKHTIANQEWNKEFGEAFNAKEAQLKSDIAEVKSKIKALGEIDETNEGQADSLQMELYQLEGSSRSLKREKDSKRKAYVEEAVRRMS